MLALRFTFPAGRYHANPWDRHVNEGEVAWPPDPWRLLRALIATWHHKVKYLGRYDEPLLTTLIDALAESLPDYTLPAANHSHTRHYLPQANPGKTALVFDAFAVVNRDNPLYLCWPTLELTVEHTALLDELLVNMGYLGRAESWVEAQQTESVPAPNCVPGNDPLDRDTGELRGEIVNLYAPVPAVEYIRRRADFLADKKQIKKLANTLPETLLDALSVDTAALQKQGWSQPPAARRVSYIRPIDAMRPQRILHKSILAKTTTARFLLVGKPLPRVEDTVRIGELVRRTVMSQAKKRLGEKNIPAIFSGHDLPTENRHQHAFYLPWDADNDGWLDHVVIHIQAGMNEHARSVIEGLRRIWQPGGGEWRLVFEGIGDASVGADLTSSCTTWHSITPYLHPWYVKKHFLIEDQIRRECRDRGLPEPEKIESLEDIPVGDRPRRPIHFHRFRSKRGLVQPDRQGSFWRLTFAESITGPLALGFGCHFGLGLFVTAALHQAGE